MKKQKGAVLVVVLSLLTISLMVGLSSMQSSQIDERLSGNYRAQSDAQMAAEAVASYAVGRLPGLNGSIFVDFNPESIFGWDDFSSSAVVDFSSAVPVDDRVYSCSAGVSCEFRYVGVNSFNSIYGLLPGDYVVSMGQSKVLLELFLKVSRCLLALGCLVLDGCQLSWLQMYLTFLRRRPLRQSLWEVKCRHLQFQAQQIKLWLRSLGRISKATLGLGSHLILCLQIPITQMVLLTL